MSDPMVALRTKCPRFCGGAWRPQLREPRLRDGVSQTNKNQGLPSSKENSAEGWPGR